MKNIINIYGAGLSGLTAAINLAREGYDVTIYEKETRIGGSDKCNPAIHMTPIDFQKMKDYIGIDIEPCFSELNIFKAYIYSKLVQFNTKFNYVVERGLNKTSLDYFLYKIAIKEGVEFEFSHPLNLETINSIPSGSIIATSSYSCLLKDLKLRYTPFVHFDSHMKIRDNDNFCIAYFDTYLAGYGYAYIAAKDRFASAEVDFFLTQAYEKNLKRFKKQLKETENLEFDKWSLVIDNIPKNIHLFKKLNGKTFVLAGAISGFHDPFFGFGVNSALVSGKIAAMTISSKKRGIQEFKRFTDNLGIMYILSKIYNYLPMKNVIIPRLFRDKTVILPIVGANLQSIPGFTHKNCFNIVKIDNL